MWENSLQPILNSLKQDISQRIYTFFFVFFFGKIGEWTFKAKRDSENNASKVFLC